LFGITSHRVSGAFTALTVALIAGALISIATPSHEQSTFRPRGYTTVVPWHDFPPGVVRRGSATSAASNTIPLWSYSIQIPVDNVTYAGSMVGRSPFAHGARTTSVPTVIVPLIMKMPDGGVFDPTVNHTCGPAGVPLTLLQQSPILNAFDFTLNGVDMGNGQYTDDFQRANFWTDVSVTGSSYHTTLSPVTTLTAITINVPTGKGQTYDAGSFGGCTGAKLAVIDNNWFGSYVDGTLIPTTLSGKALPTNFPLLLMFNVVQASGSTDINSPTCCILGYHESLGSPMQTFTPFDFDTSGVFSGVSDTSVLAHEVGEWMDDPSGNNATPSWGGVGQVSGCQNNLEVGDPLSGQPNITATMPNTTTYSLQELAFFSWFFRQNPSLGAGGLWSDNGTFGLSSLQPIC